jgi:type IV pilus assembly protein PilA
MPTRFKNTILNSLRSKAGFTLMELLIAVSIIAIISAVGITTFSQSQKLARDSKRKSDLRSVAVALELYYQKNKRYPCPGDNVWVSSSAGGNWITDNDFANCGDTSAKVLDTNYISNVPVDPVNSGTGTTWGGSITGYFYGYRGYYSAFCNSKKGQVYFLVAQLENKNDPDRNSVAQVKDCNGVPITSGGWDSAFVLTNG